MAIPCQCMGDEDGVGGIGIQRAPGLVSQDDFRQRRTGLKRIGTGVQVLQDAVGGVVQRRCRFCVIKDHVCLHTHRVP
ncbi:hypothetical protein D9M71_760100 [compost metagenome]